MLPPDVAGAWLRNRVGHVEEAHVHRAQSRLRRGMPQHCGSTRAVYHIVKTDTNLKTSTSFLRTSPTATIPTLSPDGHAMAIGRSYSRVHTLGTKEKRGTNEALLG